MSVNRLADYLDHMEQAATDACSFVEGLSKEEFLVDKRTQQAVIMSLIIIGEAATKVMDRHPQFVSEHPEVLGATCEGCATASLMGTSTLILTWCGTRWRRHCRRC